MKTVLLLIFGALSLVRSACVAQAPAAPAHAPRQSVIRF
jgi:hypothetical protein